MNNCKSCGIAIPDGQKFCSMCYGDPAYGRDNYYNDWLKQEDDRREREKDEKEGE